MATLQAMMAIGIATLLCAPPESDNLGWPAMIAYVARLLLGIIIIVHVPIARIAGT